MLLVECACGCKKPIHVKRLRGRSKFYIAGHQSRGKKLSPEHRAKLNWTGRRHKPETKVKMSISGQNRSPEDNQRMTAHLTGRKQSQETKNRRRETREKRTPEQKSETSAKLSRIWKGRKHKPESRAKISMSLQGHPPTNLNPIEATRASMTPEANSKRSASLKGRRPSEATLSPASQAKRIAKWRTNPANVARATSILISLNYPGWEDDLARGEIMDDLL